MASDEDDFVLYGTPIEREEEFTNRKKKSVAEISGNLHTLVPWKQEVRDEKRRIRFHGAFNGVEQVLAQLIRVSDGYETQLQRSWRHAFQSILQVN
ncbi:hypothetical protein ACFX11_012613 [Malus domestica]